MSSPFIIRSFEQHKTKGISHEGVTSSGMATYLIQKLRNRVKLLFKSPTIKQTLRPQMLSMYQKFYCQGLVDMIVCNDHHAQEALREAIEEALVLNPSLPETTALLKSIGEKTLKHNNEAMRRDLGVWFLELQERVLNRKSAVGSGAAGLNNDVTPMRSKL